MHLLSCAGCKVRYKQSEGGREKAGQGVDYRELREQRFCKARGKIARQECKIRVDGWPGHMADVVREKHTSEKYATGLPGTGGEPPSAFSAAAHSGSCSLILACHAS